jgi:hypothetical protein
MQRLLVSLVAVPLLTVAATAQGACFEQNFGILAPLTGGAAGYGDDVQFDLAPLGFNFPMGGLATTYSHASISDNGIIYLTTGGATTAATGAGNGYQNTQYFVGDPGSDPRIAPLFMDMWSDAVNGGGVWINDQIPGKFVVTWENMVEWFATTQPGQPAIFTFQAQLFNTGEVIFYYGPNVDGATSAAQIVVRCGVSEGNGVADPGPSDLSTNPQNLTSNILYEEFAFGPGIFDLANQSASLLHTFPGYIAVAGACEPAVNINYGSGCYNISDTYYELVDPVGMDLSGIKITALSAGGAPGTGHVVSVGPGPGNFVPGPTAVAVPLGDDAEAPAGTLGLSLGSNCWVATAAGNSLGFTPSISTMLDQGSDQVSAWTDMQPNASGSGQVYYEESGTLATVTYDGVWGWNTTNPNTVQFTYDTATGDYSIEFGVLSTVNPENWLVGFSPAGPSVDGGNQDISAAGTFVSSSANVDALKLSASGAPISTASAGSTVTYTTDNMVEFGGGVYIGMNIISLSQSAVGTPLAFLGAPGCQAYVNTLDATQAMVGFTSTQSVTLPVPAGLPSGTEVYSQSVNLVVPNSLPNGQNAFGIITSDAVVTRVSSF